MWCVAVPQREQPVTPKRPRRSMAAALEAAQQSFESAGDQSSMDGECANTAEIDSLVRWLHRLQ